MSETRNDFGYLIDAVDSLNDLKSASLFYFAALFDKLDIKDNEPIYLSEQTILGAYTISKWIEEKIAILGDNLNDELNKQRNPVVNSTSNVYEIIQLMKKK